jgi:hypothetical protein
MSLQTPDCSQISSNDHCRPYLACNHLAAMEISPVSIRNLGHSAVRLAIVGASILIDANVLLYAGLVLLPVALGLPLSRQYGSLASLFVLGVFSNLVLLDSDYYSGSILNTQPFYPLYVIPLVWMLVSVAPLLLLRAQTLRGRATGLLAPALVWGTARIAVPLLFRPDFHPLSIWLGDALLSAFVLFVLALTFYLYSQSGNPITPSKDVQVSQTVYNGL